MTRGGRFALLTNFREANPNSVVGAPSRGALPTDFLKGTTSPLAYLACLDPASHNGFNLVVGDLAAREVAYLTNRGGDASARGVPRALAPGVYGLSNGTLGCSGWAKVDRGVEAITGLLVAGGALSDAAGASSPDTLQWSSLFDGVLLDATRAPPTSLPATGIPPTIEHVLSSTFVPPFDIFGDGVTYGTRSQTASRSWRDGRAALRERSAAAATNVCCERSTHRGQVGGDHPPSPRPPTHECPHTHECEGGWVTVGASVCGSSRWRPAEVGNGASASRARLVVDEEGECAGDATELASSV